jgi:DnaJ-class molecular chaperone
MMSEEDRRTIEELWSGLETQPYHVFLGVTEEAAGDDLRAAFHERAARFHPDRWYTGVDDETRGKVYAVYKRITEAYRVLSTPDARRQYLAQRQAGANRLDPSATDRQIGPKRPEDAVKNPAAKKYYLMALDAERRKDDRSAKLNLNLALQLDPDNEHLRAKLDQILNAEKAR